MRITAENRRYQGRGCRSAYFLPIVPIWDPMVEHGAYGAIPHTHQVESQHLATLTRRLPFARRARYSRNPKNDAFACVRSWWSVKKRRESPPGYATFPVDPLNCRQSFMPACILFRHFGTSNSSCQSHVSELWQVLPGLHCFQLPDRDRYNAGNARIIRYDGDPLVGSFQQLDQVGHVWREANHHQKEVFMETTLTPLRCSHCRYLHGD